MNRTFASRRKIERYAQLLEKSDVAPHHHSQSLVDDELSDLVAVAASLQHMGETAHANVGGPSESFRTQTRALLMTAVAREGIGRTAIPAQRTGPTVRSPRAGIASRLHSGIAAVHGRGRGVRARIAVLVGLALGVLALSGISAASGSAMPGDRLYGLKRAQESAELALAASDASKGKLYLDYAAARLSEAKAVHLNADLLTSTLADMDDETKRGVALLAADAVGHHDTGPLSLIAQFVQDQDSAINGLLGEVGPNSPAARDRVLSSVTLLDRVNLRVDKLRKAFGCPSIPAVSTDELGPDPSQTCEHSAPIGARPILPGGRPGG